MSDQKKTQSEEVVENLPRPIPPPPLTDEPDYPTSLISQPPSREAVARREQEEKEWQKGLLIIEGYLNGYLQGEIKFDEMCICVEGALRRFPNEIGRQRWLGYIVEKAVRGRPPKYCRRLKHPSSQRQIAAGLVELANVRDGYRKKPSRHEPNGASAFEFVSRIWGDLGVRMTPRQVEKYWSEYRNSAKVRDE